MTFCVLGSANEKRRYNVNVVSHWPNPHTERLLSVDSQWFTIELSGEWAWYLWFKAVLHDDIMTWRHFPHNWLFALLSTWISEEQNSRVTSCSGHSCVATLMTRNYSSHFSPNHVGVFITKKKKHFLIFESTVQHLIACLIFYTKQGFSLWCWAQWVPSYYFCQWQRKLTVSKGLVAVNVCSCLTPSHCLN